MKVEERIKELTRRMEKIEQKNRELEREKEQLKRRNKSLERKLGLTEEQRETEEVSRRSFLKKIGAGAAGIGAIGVTSASGLKLTRNGISSSSGLEFLESGSEYIEVNTGGPVEVTNTDLRLGTGQSIQGGNGNGRVAFNSSNTRLYGENGNKNNNILVSDANGISQATDSNWKVRDENGSFDPINYITSASAPGTLKLENSILKYRTLNFSSRNRIEETESSDGNIRYSKDQQYTDTVGTSATPVISVADGGALILVSGRDTNGGNTWWSDVVHFNRNTSPTVISSQSAGGADNRTYTRNGTTTLELAMSASTHRVSASAETTIPQRG